jgi:hypothetical protein
MREAVALGFVRSDPAHVPVGVVRDLGIAAPTVVVDARHYAVVAVLEAGVDGVYVIGRQQRPVEHIATAVMAEVARLVGLDGGDHPQGADGGIEQRGDGGDGLVARLVHEPLRHLPQRAVVGAVAEGNDRHEGRKHEQGEQRSDADL